MALLRIALAANRSFVGAAPSLKRAKSNNNTGRRSRTDTNATVLAARRPG
jgi:hypothetical protein